MILSIVIQAAYKIVDVVRLCNIYSHFIEIERQNVNDLLYKSQKLQYNLTINMIGVNRYVKNSGFQIL